MKYREIQHDRIFRSIKFIPTGVRPSFDPNLRNAERIIAEPPDPNPAEEYPNPAIVDIIPLNYVFEPGVFNLQATVNWTYGDPTTIGSEATWWLVEERADVNIIGNVLTLGETATEGNVVIGVSYEGYTAEATYEIDYTIPIASYFYPEPEYVDDATYFPYTFKACNVEPLTSTAISDDGPSITEWTRSAEPNESILMGMHNDSDVEFHTIENTFIARECTTVKTENNTAIVTMPAEVPLTDIYWIVPSTVGSPALCGKPVPVNKAEFWWSSCDTCVTGHGESIIVYGQNFDLGDGIAQLYIIEEDLWVEPTTLNPYRAEFICPELTPGEYTCRIHNGHGQKYGFSEPFTINVDEAFEWSTARFQIQGTNAAALTYAMDRVYSAAPEDSTIYLPNGTYVMDNYIKKGGKYCRILGESRDGVIITCSSTFYEDTVPIPGTSEKRPVITFNNFTKLTLENLTLTVDEVGYPHEVDYISAYYVASNNVTFENVKVTSVGKGQNLNLLLFDGGYSSYPLTKYNILLNNCIFELSRPFGIKNNISGFRVTNCDIKGIYDCNALFAAAGEPKNMAVENCTIGHYDNSSAADGDGWGKGRFLTFANQGLQNFYYGDNSIVDYQPRVPTPFWDNVGTITNISAITGPFSDPRTGFGRFENDVWEVTFTFADIPDEYDGRGDNSILWSGVYATFPLAAGAPSATLKGSIHEMDAINNIMVVWFREEDGSETRVPYLQLPETNTVSLVDNVDQNSGEMILMEYGDDGGVEGRLSVVSATPTSTTFGSYEGGTSMIIVDGKGIGQSVAITSWDGYTANHTAWNVVPDNTSVIVFGNFYRNCVVYNSSFQGTDPTIGTATAPLKLYGVAHNWIFDNCTVENSREGVSLWSYAFDHDHDPVAYSAPMYFIDVKNSTFDNVNIGYRVDYRYYPGDTVGSEDPTFLGVRFGNNTYTNVISYYGTEVYSENAEHGTPTCYVQSLHDNETTDLATINRAGYGTQWPQTYL